MDIKNGMFALILIWVSFLPTGVLANVGGQSVSITIGQPVHFLGVDGSDALIAPATYSVEAADTWLRLVPGERRDAILLEAEGVVHQETINEPVASLTSVDEDTQEIMLFLPDGTGLKALGTYSGVMSRGVSPGKQTNRLALRTPAVSSQKAKPRAQERKPRVMKKKREGGFLTPEDPVDKLLLDLIHLQAQRIKDLEEKLNKRIDRFFKKYAEHSHFIKHGNAKHIVGHTHFETWLEDQKSVANIRPNFGVLMIDPNNEGPDEWTTPACRSAVGSAYCNLSK
jgi:hypothetical protein